VYPEVVELPPGLSERKKFGKRPLHFLKSAAQPTMEEPKKLNLDPRFRGTKDLIFGAEEREEARLQQEEVARRLDEDRENTLDEKKEEAWVPLRVYREIRARSRKGRVYGEMGTRLKVHGRVEEEREMMPEREQWEHAKRTAEAIQMTKEDKWVTELEELKKKEAETEAAKNLFEEQVKRLKQDTDDNFKPPIYFTDAVGRRFCFPWNIIKTWKVRYCSTKSTLVLTTGREWSLSFMRHSYIPSPSASRL
jgi:hypothetical protein